MEETFVEPEVQVETEGEGQPHAAHQEAGAFAVSADDFSALEERVIRAVELVKRERQARTAAEERAAASEARAAKSEERTARAEGQLHEQSPVVEQLQSELNALRAERDQVRQRVERLLKQLDALEL